MTAKMNQRAFLTGRLRRLAAMLAVIVIMVCSMASPVLAASPDAVGGGTSTTVNTEQSIFGDDGTGPYGDISTPDEILGQTGDTVSVDDVNDWVDRKGNEIIGIFQTAARPICIIGAFLCLFLIVAGAIGNSRLLFAGVVGMIICGLCFAAATCMPELISAFSGWASS